LAPGIKSAQQLNRASALEIARWPITHMRRGLFTWVISSSSCRNVSNRIGNFTAGM
jgi:hypothetical protein